MTRKIKLGWGQKRVEKATPTWKIVKDMRSLGIVVNTEFDIPENRDELELILFEDYDNKSNREKCALLEAWWGGRPVHSKNNEYYSLETYRLLKCLSWEEFFATIDKGKYDKFIVERKKHWERVLQQEEETASGMELASVMRSHPPSDFRPFFDDFNRIKTKSFAFKNDRVKTYSFSLHGTGFTRLEREGVTYEIPRVLSDQEIVNNLSHPFDYPLHWEPVND